MVSFAVEVENLYQGKVLVQDRTQKSRMSAHQRAISQVFAKVTGDKAILENKKIQNTVNYRSANFIMSYTYVTDEHDRTFLVDEFDQKRIDELLKEVGASIWGKRRPQTIVWLVKEEGIQRNIVDPVYDPQLADFIEQSASDRGLPIQIATKQLASSNQVYTSDIWGRFYSPILEASKSINIDNVLIARMRYVDKNIDTDFQTGWLLEYQLIDANGQQFSLQQNSNQFDALRNMIDDLGQHYAKQYAVDSMQLQSDTIELTLSDYDNVINLTKAEKLLSSVSAVETISLKQLSKNKAYFDIKLTGEPLDLVRGIELLPQFKQLIQQSTPSTATTEIASIEEQIARLATTTTSSSIIELASREKDAATEPKVLNYQWLDN
jgi:hypothetical protein